MVTLSKSVFWAAVNRSNMPTISRREGRIVFARPDNHRMVASMTCKGWEYYIMPGCSHGCKVLCNHFKSCKCERCTEARDDRGLLLTDNGQIVRTGVDSLAGY